MANSLPVAVLIDADTAYGLRTVFDRMTGGAIAVLHLEELASQIEGLVTYDQIAEAGYVDSTTGYIQAVPSRPVPEN